MPKPVFSIHRLINQYFALIKSRQTLMLTFTGVAGYLSHSPPDLSWQVLVQLVASLVLTISGCTVLNMLIDRDLDRCMMRTSHRPLATGQVSVRSAAILGIGLLALGLGWSYLLSGLYFLLACIGVVGDVLVYTLWLKRRTSWSIIWGGIAGGIPILAGRSLATGNIDPEGLLLALAVVCWIPSHNFTLGMLCAEDYRQAGVPTFHFEYGFKRTRLAVLLSSLLAILLVASALTRLGVSLLVMVIMVVLSLGWVGLAINHSMHPTNHNLTWLYKSSSVYMMGIMLLLVLAGV